MATIETCHFLMRRILIEYHNNYWLTVLRNDITEVRGVGTRFFALIIRNKMAALFHVNCGTIPCQLWHYSMSSVPLLPLRQANRMFLEDVQTFSWFV